MSCPLVTLTTAAPAYGTAIQLVDFTDSEDRTVSPLDATWTLTDTLGIVPNGKYRQTLAVTEGRGRVVMSGADLTPGGPSLTRILTIEGTYDSETDGPNLPIWKQFAFEIEWFGIAPFAPAGD